jgi:hypothetical protein
MRVGVWAAGGERCGGAGAAGGSGAAASPAGVASPAVRGCPPPRLSPPLPPPPRPPPDGVDDRRLHVSTAGPSGATGWGRGLSRRADAAAKGAARPRLPTPHRATRPSGPPPPPQNRFVVGISALFWGPFADRYGRRKTLLISSGAFTAVSIGCVFAPNIERERARRWPRRRLTSRGAHRLPDAAAAAYKPASRLPASPPLSDTSARPCSQPLPSARRAPRAPGRVRVRHDGVLQRGAGGLVGAGAARQGHGHLHDPHP